MPKHNSLHFCAIFTSSQNVDRQYYIAALLFTFVSLFLQDVCQRNNEDQINT